jgi:trimeric autotransporter adhesin
MAFRLYDALSSGTLIGSPITTSVPVANGLFTVGLDFGSNGNVFDGNGRWLDIQVNCTGTFVALTPRQLLTAAPYAFALPGLYTQPNAASPNIIGGFSDNFISSTVVGGVIGGGGSSGFINRVQADYATVGGGRVNIAGGSHSTVGGGFHNTAIGSGATIGGGGYDGTTISGNQAVGNASTIGGGLGNSIPVTGTSATIGGGWNNTASNAWATVGGGLFNTAGREATVAGGQGNTASSQWATVGGGWNNSNNGYLGTLGGGSGNIVSGTQATFGGGASNIVSGTLATVGGGLGTTAGGAGAFVGGGGNDGTSTAANQALGGGAAIGGGIGNTIPIAGKKAFIGGGDGNTASGFGAAIGGGVSNIASGVDATVPGGVANLAQGSGSFAAGWQAKANNDGCFVWADFTGSALNCNINNAFYARASGGVTLYTNAGATIGAALAPGSGSWSVVSDRNLKENLTPVDSRYVLARLARVPMQTWNYTTQDASIRHIGPTAQDFAAAFHVGENDTTISTVDAQGVALAAIQGLYQENQDLKAQNASLEARMTNLEQNTQPAAFNWFNLIGLVALALSGMTLLGVQRQWKRGGRA